MVDRESDSTSFANRGWGAKFKFAIRGVLLGLKSPSQTAAQNSFLIHIPCSIVVLVAGAWLNVGWVAMATLVMCCAMVLVAEMFNSSIESIAKAITPQHDSHIGVALDIAAGAVLLASLAAVIVGGLIFVPCLLELLV